MKARREQGFTLIELMVVITILGLLAGITSVAVLPRLRDARIATCKQSMRNLVEAIELYEAKKGRIPQQLSDLITQDHDFINADEVPKDPWGKEFIYEPRNRRDYDLYTLGSDGVEGGTDKEEKDIHRADLNKSDDEETK